jgi:hypothetical protein
MDQFPLHECIVESLSLIHRERQYSVALGDGIFPGPHFPYSTISQMKICPHIFT